MKKLNLSQILKVEKRKEDEPYTIFSKRFSDEVAKAHKKFFEKRGMQIKTLNDSLFFKNRGGNPSSSECLNDPPTSQSSPVKHYNPQT